jgi:hypothetical protein
MTLEFEFAVGNTGPGCVKSSEVRSEHDSGSAMSDAGRLFLDGWTAGCSCAMAALAGAHNLLERR